jgi:Caspase domain
MRRLSLMILVLYALFAPVMVSALTESEPRRALVIGNAAYPEHPLRNPLHDATDLADTLRRFHFVVTLITDADKPTMERAVEDFTQGVAPQTAGLFFFAGHGVQIEGLNYLIPVGATFETTSDVKYRAVLADWISARMDESGMAVKILILDACRNNPFGRGWRSRALNGGLAQMQAPEGTLISYSTSPGKTAADGAGRNSPFTASLLQEIPQPQRPIELMFKAVRARVHDETGMQQTPWEASSLRGNFSFAPDAPPVVSTAPAPVTPSPAPPQPTPPAAGVLQPAPSPPNLPPTLGAPAELLVGTWRFTGVELGQRVNILWHLRTDGTQTYIINGVAQGAGTWQYIGAHIYERYPDGRQGEGAIQILDRDHFVVTIVDNGFPAHTGLQRLYSRQ